MNKQPKIRIRKKQKTKKNNDKDGKATDYQLIRALDLVKALYLYGQNDNADIEAEEQKIEEKAEVK